MNKIIFFSTTLFLAKNTYADLIVGPGDIVNQVVRDPEVRRSVAILLLESPIFWGIIIAIFVFSIFLNFRKKK